MSVALLPVPLPAIDRPGGLVWRLLGPPDVDAVDALHRDAVRGMGVHAVKLEEKSFFLSLLSGRGRILGLERGSELVAYGVLQHDLKAEDDPCEGLGLSPGTSVVKLAGAAVGYDWRGAGLQRLLIEARVGLAGDAGVIFSTAAPANQPSWSSLLACGLAVRALLYRYGGHPRFLMARVDAGLNGASPDLGHPGELLDCADLARQTQCLEQGWWGIAAGPRASTIRYVPAR